MYTLWVALIYTSADNGDHLSHVILRKLFSSLKVMGHTRKCFGRTDRWSNLGHSTNSLHYLHYTTGDK